MTIGCIYQVDKYDVQMAEHWHFARVRDIHSSEIYRRLRDMLDSPTVSSLTRPVRYKIVKLELWFTFAFGRVLSKDEKYKMNMREGDRTEELLLTLSSPFKRNHVNTVQLIETDSRRKSWQQTHAVYRFRSKKSIFSTMLVLAEGSSFLFFAQFESPGVSDQDALYRINNSLYCCNWSWHSLTGLNLKNIVWGTCICKWLKYQM